MYVEFYWSEQLFIVSSFGEISIIYFFFTLKKFVYTFIEWGYMNYILWSSLSIVQWAHKYFKLVMPQAKVGMYLHLYEAIIKKLISKLKTE